MYFSLFDFRMQVAVDVTTGSSTRKEDQHMGTRNAVAHIHLIRSKDIVNISSGDACTVSVCAMKKLQYLNVM